MARFFDDLVAGVSKGVNKVSEGSKVMVEKATLNTQIREKEREKNQLLQNMGTLVYNLITSGVISIEQCEGMCNEVANVDKTIAYLQQQIQELEAPRSTVPQYQYAPPAYEQPAQPTYEQSAQPTYEQPAPQESAVSGVQCACGFVNKEGARFCAKCGQPLQ